MRSAVVKQMKNPIEKRTMRPMRDPVDMFSFMITGIGGMKMEMSVKRLVTAFVQLFLGQHSLICINVTRESDLLTGATRS